VSGETFDLERFQELTELEETVEVLTAEVEDRTVRAAAERETETEAYEKLTEKHTESGEAELLRESAGSETESAAEPEESAAPRPEAKEETTESISDRRETGEKLPPEVLRLYIPEKAETEARAVFADEPPVGGERNSSYQEWGRRWERESRRYDGGFPLY